MRLFIALHLPDAVRHELAGAQARLGSGHPLRWVDAGSMHLTLQFIGEAPEELAAALLGGLAALAPPPFRLRLGGLGAFPSPRRARVVWAAVEGDTAALAELQRAVLAVTAPLGVAAEERPFRAHLTLGRMRQEARPEQLRALGDALAGAAPPAPLEWEAGRPTLFQSTLTPRGPVYRALGPE
jgi:2'-5' RNA ligase